MNVAVIELQLVHRIGDPVLAETFPGKYIDGALAEHGPHAHFDSAGIGSRHDGDPVIFRQAENILGAFNRLLQLGFCSGRPVRASERCRFQFFE